MNMLINNHSFCPGHICQPLFHMIPLENWFADELHVMLRITDRLWVLILAELCVNNDLMLQEFNYNNLFCQSRATLIRQLQDKFYELCTSLLDIIMSLK
nr:2504_t:CDS:2 [Entrophospora candida]